MEKCIVNPCFRIQMSSASSTSLLTSSDEDEEDVEFLVNERGTVRTGKVNGGGRRQQLPWHDNYWSIKITHVVSPNEVWATLTNNAVSKIQFNDLIFEIERKKPITTVLLFDVIFENHMVLCIGVVLFVCFPFSILTFRVYWFKPNRWYRF